MTDQFGPPLKTRMFTEELVSLTLTLKEMPGNLSLKTPSSKYLSVLAKYGVLTICTKSLEEEV